MDSLKKNFRHDKPFGRSFLYTMLFLASSHLSISLIVGILDDNVDSVNMFHILAYDQVFPALGKGSGMAFLSVIFVVGVWSGILYVLTHHARLERAKKS